MTTEGCGGVCRGGVGGDVVGWNVVGRGGARCRGVKGFVLPALWGTSGEESRITRRAAIKL